MGSGSYTDCAFLAQAVPEAFEPQRKLRPAVLVAPVQGQQRAVSFWNGLSETLGFVRVSTIAEAAPFRDNLCLPKALGGRGVDVLRSADEAGDGPPPSLHVLTASLAATYFMYDSYKVLYDPRPRCW